MAAAKTAKREKRGGFAEAWAYYRDATQQPLYSLLFLFPIVIAYEAGAIMQRHSIWPQRTLVAQGVVQSILGWFGADTPWLSGAAVVLVVTLLTWHIFSGRTWRIRAWVLPAMALESVILTIPLFVNNRFAIGVVLHQALGDGSFDTLKSHFLLSIGAALYEELVFRLALLGLLMLLLHYSMNVPRAASAATAIVLSAIIFALCHVQPVGAERLEWGKFFVRVTAGAYLSLIFMMRGLGISSGCHAAFNLALVCGWSL